MPKPKFYKSPIKLGSLPVGSRIAFEGELLIWVKEENGWFRGASSFPVPWSSETMWHYNNGRPFQVISTGGEEKP